MQFVSGWLAYQRWMKCLSVLKSDMRYVWYCSQASTRTAPCNWLYTTGQLFPGLFHVALACRAQLVSGKQERIQSVFPKKETFGFGHSFQVWTSSFTLIPKARGIPVSPSSSFHPAQHQVTHREDTHNYPQNLNVLFHFFLKHFCTEKQILIC